MYARLLCTLPLALLIAACTPSTDGAEVAARPPVPSTGGFAPLRAETITVSGGGAWVCTPAGAGQPSRCAPKIAGRPGLVPVPNPVEPLDGAAPQATASTSPSSSSPAPTAADTAAALEAARQGGAPIPMDVPG